ncbi:hypothetical protein JCM10450v2_006074 [Rhodotorula kratochvilovae]
MPNVYHGYDGLAKNPQSSPEMKAYAHDQMARMSNQWHGQHGAFHNPSTGGDGKGHAMQGMQNTQPDTWKGR